ncbi:transposase [Streptomyces sp. NRRL S-340]|uniref:IS701 family transposase n=1 Tax=Streptomyces sp. NRRL S-340 TaxID=1463901 RepID=UPI000A537D11|nr:transposase [Streptomyces sp. NRRL S-340]
MTYADVHPEISGRAVLPSLAPHPRDAVFDQLTPGLFASLIRSDQHRKALYYLRGLLEAEGRKSIRAIAALFGDDVSEQNLHHFVSSSTWDWMPMRRALADHLTGVTHPQAWVARLMIIPKSGRHSVGVGRHFFPSLGQVLNAQRAIGVWAASEEVTVPVNWRLHLPRTWLKDHQRRSQVAIPDGAGPETLTESLARVCAETLLDWNLPRRPLVVDSDEVQAATLFREFADSGVPLLVRACDGLGLTVTDPLLPAGEGQTMPADQIMGMARDLRRPANRGDAHADTTRHTHLAATVRVALPDPGGWAASQGELALLGVEDARGRGRTQLWLTNMTGVQPALLVRLTGLTEKVGADFTEISEEVGIRDFTGRSFGGWHRHVTLASAAHAIVALAGRARRGASSASGRSRERGPVACVESHRRVS